MANFKNSINLFKFPKK